MGSPTNTVGESINGEDHNSNFLGDLVKKGGDAIAGFMDKAK